MSGPTDDVAETGGSSESSGQDVKAAPPKEPETDREELAEDEAEAFTEPLSKDDVFGVLSNQRRRLLLETLVAGEAEGMDLSAATTAVAGAEKGVDPDELEYDERKTVHISIYQHHAPKLDDLGVVDYDKRSGRISIGERFDDVRPYLEVQGPADEEAEVSPETVGTGSDADTADATGSVVNDGGTSNASGGPTWAEYLPIAFVGVAGLLAIGHLGGASGPDVLWAALTAVSVLALGVAHWIAFRSKPSGKR